MTEQCEYVFVSGTGGIVSWTQGLDRARAVAFADFKDGEWYWGVRPWERALGQAVRSDQPSNGYRLWRDPIRKGWWVAKEGVRYVAVEGVPEGQNHRSCSSLDGARNAARCLNMGVTDWMSTGMGAATGVGDAAIIDLHDLGPASTVVGNRITVIGGSEDRSPRQRAREFVAGRWVAKAGDRVTRGPDWKWGSQDTGGIGTITEIDMDGWALVRWDGDPSNSACHAYRTSQSSNGCAAQDLVPAHRQDHEGGDA